MFSWLLFYVPIITFVTLKSIKPLVFPTFRFVIIITFISLKVLAARRFLHFLFN